MIKVNLNATVKIELNELGKERYKEIYKDEEDEIVCALFTAIDIHSKLSSGYEAVF